MEDTFWNTWLGWSMILKYTLKIVVGGVGWIYVAQDTAQCWAVRHGNESSTSIKGQLSDS